MERLTQTSNSGGVAFTFDLDITCQPSEARKILNLATKLKDYEDAEEQDRLIKLPCKVGDTLYRLVPNLYRKYVEIKIAQFVINKNEIYFTTNKGVSLSVGKIGKTIFRTKAEAEAKLKELRGREDESSD